MSAGPGGEAPTAHVDFSVEPLPGARLHELLARARAAGPVAPAVLWGRPAFLVTRFAELRGLFAAPDRFPGGAIYELHTRPALGSTFINMDGPVHDAYRVLVMPAFRSRAAARFVEEKLVPLAHEVVDRFAARGRADLVAELAHVLPFWAISRKLGLPVGSEDRNRRWALALLGYPLDPGRALAASAEVTRFLEPIIERHRRELGDDVLSHLLTSEHKGVRLSDEEVFAHVRLLFTVGATTTSDAMSNLFWTLLTRPELLERARREPAVRPAIVQELLRWEPPVALLPRLAPDGGEIAGVALPRGAVVLAGITAANRDPAAFDDPDRFDPDRFAPDRAAPEVLTFGLGSKFCPGAQFARRQLLAALDVVLERLPGLRLVEASEPSGAVLRSVPRLEVEWERELSRR